MSRMDSQEFDSASCMCCKLYSLLHNTKDWVHPGLARRQVLGTSNPISMVIYMQSTAYF